MTRIQLSEADAGHTSSVSTSDMVEITLPEIPTTGYRWAWTLPAGARTVLNEYVAAPPGRPGQGGQRQLVFELDRPGQHRLRAELVRPWEPGAHRVLTFDLDVHDG